MRFLFAALLVATVPAFANGVSIVRVWPEYRPASSFERISEYFTGREKTGRQTILRSQPAERAGYYFLVRLKNDTTPIADATFIVRVITPQSPRPREFRFATAVPTGSRAFSVGLTGSDWSDASAEPVAWEVTVLGSDGTELAREKSFLWGNATPAATAP